MEITRLELSDVSALRSRCYLCQFAGTPKAKALILEFAGRYGGGSEGNNDAHYMEAIKSAWLSLYHAQAVVGQTMLIARVLAGDQWQTITIPRGGSQAFNEQMWGQPQ